MSKYTKIVLILTIGLGISACGQSSSSSSSSSSAPSGFTGEQKDKFNNLSPEGKEYVKKQMDAYDRAKR